MPGVSGIFAVALVPPGSVFRFLPVLQQTLGLPYAPLAQLAEHRPFKADRQGSNPWRRTKRNKLEGGTLSLIHL